MQLVCMQFWMDSGLGLCLCIKGPSSNVWDWIKPIQQEPALDLLKLTECRTQLTCAVSAWDPAASWDWACGHASRVQN